MPTYKFKVTIVGKLIDGNRVEEVLLPEVEAMGSSKARDYAKARCKDQLARFEPLGRSIKVERILGEP